MAVRVSNRFTWKIAGEAGFGINTAGLLFSKIVSRSGLYGFEYSEYPSLIRGGHQTSQVTVDTLPVYGAHFGIHTLVGLNRDSLHLHSQELNKGSAVLFDEAQFALSSAEAQLGAKIKEVMLFSVPFTQLAIEKAGLNIMRNMVAVGSSLCLLGFDLEIARELVEETYAKAAKENIAALEAGFQYMEEHYHSLVAAYLYKRGARQVEDRPYVVTGNEALGLGALAGGVSFYAAYPMTPSSTLMAFMAEHQYEYGVVLRHAEDEIAVINMAVGASFAGARAMVGTSGGGMALMAEAVGMAAITEVPIVVVNVQRPGPATGLPTWTDQGDLRFVLHAAQGEFTRVVFTPGDMEECYAAAWQALNIAEKYQLPVFILSDKYLAESHATVLQFPEDVVEVERGKLVTTSDELVQLNENGMVLPYERYSPSNDGVWYRTVPGVQHGVYLANSDEHDGNGFSNEEAEVRVEQVDTRAMKLHAVQPELPLPTLYGNENSSVLLVGWGSVKGPVLEAMKLLEEEYDTQVAFMHIACIWPFPKDFVKKMLEKFRRVIVIENNSTAQLKGLLGQMVYYHTRESWLRYDGRPFFADELYSKLEKVIRNEK